MTNFFKTFVSTVAEEEEESINIMLKSADGQIILLQKQAMLPSKFITNLVQKAGPEAEKKPIHIKYLSSSILKKVVEFLEQYFKYPNVGNWGTAFLGTHYPTISQLNLAAVYLEISQLYEVTNFAMFEMTKGKSKRELRRFYDSQDKFTLEDEERMYTDFN